MTPQAFLQRLLDYERRVEKLYRTLEGYPSFPTELRSFWRRMAEDERHHVAVLTRSSSLEDLQEYAPEVSDEVFREIEKKLTAAEAAITHVDVSADEALRHALILEGSELNRLNEEWFHCFPVALSTMLSALIPEDNVHLRRLVEAVHSFSTNKALHEQATTFWMLYQRTAAGLIQTKEKTQPRNSKAHS